MNFRKKSPWTANPGVPLTPMIDVVFLLLCFFVTSQIFAQWETEIDVALPTAATGGAPQRLPGEVIVNVLLDRLVELFPGQPVLLRADKATAYEHVVRVLDTCRQADVWNISFATLAPGS